MKNTAAITKTSTQGVRFDWTKAIVEAAAAKAAQLQAQAGQSK